MFVLAAIIRFLVQLLFLTWVYPATRTLIPIKEEKEMAHLYERRKFPYPGDKEAVDEFIASGGTIGTTIGPKGLIETGEDADNFQKKLQSKKFEQESLKMWFRMRNEVISELQEKGYDVE